jgi:hypothetical protein
MCFLHAQGKTKTQIHRQLVAMWCVSFQNRSVDMYWKIKNMFGQTLWFLSDNDDTEGAINWLHAIDAYFFAKGSDTLVFHWMNALTGGDYVES